jgi:intracellular multiplication protein IcmP
MAASQQQSGQGESSSGMLWIVSAILITVAGLWFAFKKQLVTAFFTLKLWEINVISLFTHGLDDVRTVMQTTDPTTFTFKEVVQMGQLVGEYLRIPFVILLFGLAFFVFFGNTARVFKRTYTMRDLLDLEQVNWPQITPVTKLDLVKTDIDKGPWAMAMTPMQFCKRHKLLDEHKRSAQEGMTRKEASQIDVTLKRGLANKIFALQLGALWQGTAKLPPHTKALFAIFAARNNGDAEAAQKLFSQLSRSSITKLDFTGVDELCQKYENTKAIQKIIHTHAYVLTVMASMLAAAREDGVQASADFLWLKPVDRRLWYMLNTVGRQTPFVEVAGAFSHWIAEKELGKKMLVPMVEEATNALDRSLKEILYKPDEQE